MSIKSVETAIRQVRAVVKEWENAGFEHDSWREEHTRYTVIDPIIRALGWNTSDPKECHPEYWRFGGRDASGRAGRVDYALFGTPDLEAIGNGITAPAVIIEAKKLGMALDGHVGQLRRYVNGTHRMTKGMAVLTNGREWWLYDLDRRGAFSGKRVDPINVLDGNLGVLAESARTLNSLLNRRKFG